MEMITLDAEERMDKTISNLAENLSTIRTGKSVFVDLSFAILIWFPFET